MCEECGGKLFHRYVNRGGYGTFTHCGKLLRGSNILEKSWRKMKKALALFKKVDYTEISGRTPTQTSEKLQNIKIKNVANTISGEVPQTNILNIVN